MEQPLDVDADAYYFSFDPNMYDRHDVRSPRTEKMYRNDVALIGRQIRALPSRPVSVQLSTDSVNNDTSQDAVYQQLLAGFDQLSL